MNIQPLPLYDPEIVTQGNISNYVPSIPTLFKQSALYGFRTMWWQEALDEVAYDLASSSETIGEEEYKESEYFRPGVSWFEGMTVEQAQILSENNDRNSHYAQLTNNISGFSSAGITGMFGGLIAGGFLDPLNFIPYYGIAKNVKRVKSLFERIKQANQAANPKQLKVLLGTI